MTIKHAFTFLWALPISNCFGAIVSTQAWLVTDAIDDGNRVARIEFDLSSSLQGIDPATIERIDWTITHTAPGVTVSLSTSHPSGANGQFTLNRWVNGFSGENGFVLPTITFPTAGLWLNSDTQVFSFPSSESPKTFDFGSATFLQELSETNQSRFSQYYDPFSIEIVTSQSLTDVVSYTFGLPAPQAGQTADPYFGNVTISVVTVPEPSCLALAACSSICLLTFRNRRREQQIAEQAGAQNP